MNEPKSQEQKAQATQQSAEYKSESKEKKDISTLLSKFGGFLAVKSFIPAADDMNPAKKAAKNIFLTESRFKEKREKLAKELEGWIELLDSGKTTATEYADECKQKEAKYQRLLNQGITIALDATHDLETTYRTLDSFFQNANTDKLYNLKLINVNKDYIKESDFSDEIDHLLKNAYDRLSLKDSYSLMVIPGNIFEKSDIRRAWAQIAFKYKVLLISDCADDTSFEDMQNNTQKLRDSDQELQNMVMAANWIVGRESEKLSDFEKDDPAFYIPPSGALAGKLYDESANMAQGAAGKTYGTLNRVKGVRNDLLKSEIAALMDNQVIPMVFSEGRVMAFNNTTLYNGDNVAMKEYPIVRVFDWIKKALLQYVNNEALKNWDSIKSPANIKKQIQDFLRPYQGYGKLFKEYTIKDPKQDPISKQITIDISITPYFAAKNFIVKMTANEGGEKNVDIKEE